MSLLPDISSIAPYPPSNYAFDANGNLGRFDPVYIFASLLWNVCTFIVQVSLAFFQWGIQGTALNGLLDAVLAVIQQGIPTLEPVAFSLALLVLAGLWVSDLLRRRQTVMWARFVKVFAALFAIWIYGHINAAFIHTLNNVTDATASSLGNAVLSLTRKGSNVSSASITLEQQIWSSLIQVPWEQGEMGGPLSIHKEDLGDVEACARTSVDWNKVQADGFHWADALLQLPVGNHDRNCMAGILNSSRYPTAQEAFASGNRLSVTFAVGFNLIGPVLFLLVFGLMAMIARAGFLITLMLGVFVLPVELFPVTRTYERTFRWALTALAGLVGTAVIDLYVAIVIVVGDVFQNAIQGAPLFLTMLWINVLYFAAIFVFFWLLRRANLRKRIRETVEKVGQRLPDRVPVGLGESIQITKPAITKALRMSRVSAVQRGVSGGGGGQSGGDDGKGGGGIPGNFASPDDGSSGAAASGGVAPLFHGPSGTNFGAADATSQGPSDPAAAANVIRLSDLDTNRRARKVLAVGFSEEGGTHGKSSNSPKDDTFVPKKGRLPKRALMTDQTRRVPLTQSLKAKALATAAALGTGALTKGALTDPFKSKKATGVVLRENTRRVPVPEALRARVLERTAELRQRLAERREQASLRNPRAKYAVDEHNTRHVSVPDKLRTKTDGVQTKLAERTVHGSAHIRRVAATGVMRTLEHRRVRLPEHLKARRDEMKSRVAGVHHALSFVETPNAVHREPPRSDAQNDAGRDTRTGSRPVDSAHENTVAHGTRAAGSVRPVARSLGSSQVKRVLGVAGQTAFQTFAMGAGMSEKTEQKIRGAVSQAARALQASAKRVQRMPATENADLTHRSPSGDQKTKPEASWPEQAQTTKVSPHASPQDASSSLSTEVTHAATRESMSSARAIVRPKVKPAEKDQTGTDGQQQAANESGEREQSATSSETRPTTVSTQTVHRPAPQAINPSGMNAKTPQATKPSLKRPSVRGERPHIRTAETERDIREISAATPPRNAQPIAKRVLTTKKQTPPKT